MEKEDLNRASAEEAYRKVVPKARINPTALQTVIELRKEMGVYKPPYDPPGASTMPVTGVRQRP